MANYCDYTLMVRGSVENVQTFYRYMTDYETSPKYFARIFSAEIDTDETADDVRTMKIFGDCAWSVHSCMREGGGSYFGDGNNPNLVCLRDVTKELSLEVEIHTEEPGMMFWEHYHYKDGECLTDETGELHSTAFDME